MTSWYLREGCVDTHELKPWWLTFICIAIQSTIAFILFIRSGTGNKKESSNKKSCCFLKNWWRAFKSTKLFNLIVSAYQIWQIISVISILVFDTLQFINYMNKHSRSSWINYNCYASIVFNSPLLITLVSNAATTNMWMNRGAGNAALMVGDNLAGQDPEAQNQIIAAQAFQKSVMKIWDVGKYKLKTRLSAMRQKMFFILYWYLAFSGLMIIYAMPGFCIFGCVIWVIYCCAVCSVICMACADAQEELNKSEFEEDLLDTNRNAKTSINIDSSGIDNNGQGMINENDEDEEVEDISKCNIFFVLVFMPLMYTFSLIIFPLMTINFYFGESWTDSIIATFNDRNWKGYWEHTTNDYEAKYRLLISLLG